MADTCVFCGQPIEAGAERSGRPPHAAHAACADAALASDVHWDAIASASGDSTASEPKDDSGPEKPRAAAGCLVILVLALVAMAVIVTSVAVAA